MSIDQRGFKTFIQEEAESFLEPGQVMLNSVVNTISYSGDGVTVTLVDGTKLEADYGLVTFSLGVLQHEDVIWEPELPAWKTEAIQSMTMVNGFLLSRHTLPITRVYTGHIYKNLLAIPSEVLVRYRGGITRSFFWFMLLRSNTDRHLCGPCSR